jgi:hypothetical protein
MTQNLSCDVDTLFPNAKTQLFCNPKYVVVNPAIKSDCWGVVDDPLKVPGCVMCLVKFLDGSPVAVRYRLTEVYVRTCVPYKEFYSIR